MGDEKKKGETSTEQSTETPNKNKGIVAVRRVILKPLSVREQLEARGETVDVAAENENAPKPIPNQQFKPRLIEIRRKHKIPGKEERPNYMSEIKL